jgi:hypothetical protein
MNTEYLSVKVKTDLKEEILYLMKELYNRKLTFSFKPPIGQINLENEKIRGATCSLIPMVQPPVDPNYPGITG